MSLQINTIQSWLERNARPLDLARYNYHFNDGSIQAIFTALSTYQNPNGGFGQALEPDFRLPLSTALATTVAFQYLTEINAGDHEPIVQNGINYFLDTYNHDSNSWPIIRPEVMQHPHAPWWDYDNSVKNFDWGNPSAEILGYLHTYQDLIPDTKLISTITEHMLIRLNEIVKPEFHEIMCFVRLYNLADDELRQLMEPSLTKLILQTIDPDPNNWRAYSATPFTFIHAPQDPLASIFDQRLIQADLKRIQHSLVDANHWEPRWNWGDTYPETWPIAKQEWSGKITVDNLLILRAFNVL